VSARLGNTKPGVGLLVDLGKPRQVTAVQLHLLGSGTSVVLLEGTDAGPPATDRQAQMVASADDAGTTVTLRPAAPTTAQYWVVWLTKLPAADNGFRGGIAEMTFES
jgi:eukaryotic-like serine/threonine-protein kinase